MAAMPVKHFTMQVASSTHFSQSTGTFDGQHGISPAIPSAVADDDVSAVTACVETGEDNPAMTGCKIGAHTRPAIITAATRRVMAIW